MTHRALVISHADADGHLIAEQVRRNLSLIESLEVDVIVDPERTRDHRAWIRLDELGEIEHADFVFFVDLMFAPASFAQEASALVDFANARPEKRFFLIDHHPLPLRRLGEAKNLRVKYRPDVFDVAIGPRSGMMVVAALCEHQASRVADVKRPEHDTLAVGMRRAAALGGPLPGPKLLALLRSNCWDELAQLGKDSPEYHRLPRGRRPSNQPRSDALEALDKTATKLLKQQGSQPMENSHRRRPAMAYDFDVGQERYSHTADEPAQLPNSRASSKDLEAIVTLLEIAALSLTTEPDEAFTLEELVKEARDIGGDEIELDDRDIKIVLEKAAFIEHVGGELRLR